MSNARLFRKDEFIIHEWVEQLRYLSTLNGYLHSLIRSTTYINEILGGGKLFPNGHRNGTLARPFLVGTSVLEIHCPNLDAWHILVSHLGVAILCTSAGLISGLTVEIWACPLSGDEQLRDWLPLDDK